MLCLSSYTSYSHAQTSALDRRTLGAGNCHVEAPAEWENAVQVTWIGLCKHGYADGLGVLRRDTRGSSTDLFSGRVEQGYLRSGVLDNGRGYEAGAWKAGSVIETSADEPGYRDALMAVYEEAAKAADATADYMAKHSNPKSARFYTHLAKSFRMQLDD